MNALPQPSIFQTFTASQPSTTNNPSQAGVSVSSAFLPATWNTLGQPLQAVPQAVGQHMNLDSVVHDLHSVHHYGEELVPALLPNASVVGSLFAPTYAVLDGYEKTRQAYEANADLSKDERLKKTAIAAGDVTLLHLIATIGLPLLLSKKIHHQVHHFLEHHPKAPPFLKTHQKWTTTLVVLGSMIALSKPIHHATEFVLDWTYRPLVDKKRREEAAEALKKQSDAQLSFLKIDSFMKRQHATAMNLPVSTSVPEKNRPS